MESKWLDGFHNHLAWLLHLEIQYKSLYRRILLPLHRSPTPPPPPPPSFRPCLLPRSPGNYEVHPPNSDYSRVLVACKIDYSSNATNLGINYLYGPCINPCEELHFGALRMQEFLSVFIQKFLWY